MTSLVLGTEVTKMSLTQSLPLGNFKYCSGEYSSEVEGSKQWSPFFKFLDRLQVKFALENTCCGIHFPSRNS